MHAAIRPYATAGVALVGAGVIAVTPVAAPLPEVQIPSLHAAVELTQLAFPVITPAQLLTDTLQNLQASAAAILANPFPILTQFIANQVGYAQDIGMGLQGAGAALASTLQGLPGQLQTAFGLLATGDVFDAATGLYTYLLDGVLLGAGLPLIEGLSPVLTGIGTHFSNLLQSLGSFGVVLGLLSVITGPNAATVAATALTQNLVTAVSTGNFGDVLTTILNAPSTLVGAFLNGYDISCNSCTIDQTAGLLTGVPGSTQPSQGDGTVGGLLMVLQTIAQALGASPPAAQSATAAASNVSPNLAAKTVTLTTAASVTAPAAAVNPATTTAPTVKAPAATAYPATSTALVVASGTAAKLPTPLNTTGNGNRAAPGTVGGKGTTAGGGLANALSKIGGGLPSKTGTHK